ncbi:uncharacterized protein LOC128549706 [Mercenaria mercenaria]|uniref:uncharacterized protein LOC128549706 n=1 Tax=Mercenaria mercenaria TaxID=6596 RepID=UPI00234F2ED2|nr:uncharacterized protein LOC128549706 [Mercenaria mercenaria]XP_053383035.1 uncharacterized protein LOC128549706 [Mercenaria mercenaria]XP_053383036.1 uncharacterized protein LOC128549706 [Mercenaria mercenaria]XP_053383037.1 uncharacterized protein LOC128549706 [Mercenaria mercenaria]
MAYCLDKANAGQPECRSEDYEDNVKVEKFFLPRVIHSKRKRRQKLHARSENTKEMVTKGSKSDSIKPEVVKSASVEPKVVNSASMKPEVVNPVSTKPEVLNPCPKKRAIVKTDTLKSLAINQLSRKVEVVKPIRKNVMNKPKKAKPNQCSKTHGVKMVDYNPEISRGPFEFNRSLSKKLIPSSADVAKGKRSKQTVNLQESFDPEGGMIIESNGKPEVIRSDCTKSGLEISRSPFEKRNLISRKGTQFKRPSNLQKKKKENSRRHAYKIRRRIIVCKMRPTNIRFTNTRFTTKFAGINKTVHDTLHELQTGLISVEDIPKLTVFRSRGKNYTFNNRRLFVFEQLASYYRKHFNIDLIIPVLFRETLNRVKVSRTFGCAPGNISQINIKEKSKNVGSIKKKFYVRSTKGRKQMCVPSGHSRMKKAEIQRCRNGDDDFVLSSVAKSELKDLSDDSEDDNHPIRSRRGRSAKRFPKLGECIKNFDDLDQYGRQNNLIFYNVPVTLSTGNMENPNQPASDKNSPDKFRSDKHIQTDDIVLEICKNMEITPTVTLDNIERSYIIGKIKENKCQIKVKFSSYRTKALVYSSKEKLKHCKTEDFNVVIHEDLTRKRQRIVQELCKLRKDKKIHSFRTQDGKIYYKESKQGKPKSLTVFEEIENFISGTDPNALFAEPQV